MALRFPFSSLVSPRALSFSDAVSVIFREPDSPTPGAGRRRGGRSQRGKPLITRTWNALSRLSRSFRPRLLRLLRRHKRSLRGLRRAGSSARALMSRLGGELGKARRKLLGGLWRTGGLESRDYHQREEEEVVPYGGALRHNRGHTPYGQQQGQIIFDNELFGFRTRVRLVENEASENSY